VGTLQLSQTARKRFNITFSVGAAILIPTKDVLCRRAIAVMEKRPYETVFRTLRKHFKTDVKQVIFYNM